MPIRGLLLRRAVLGVLLRERGSMTVAEVVSELHARGVTTQGRLLGDAGGIQSHHEVALSALAGRPADQSRILKEAERGTTSSASQARATPRLDSSTRSEGVAEQRHGAVPRLGGRLGGVHLRAGVVEERVLATGVDVHRGVLAQLAQH